MGYSQVFELSVVFASELGLVKGGFSHTIGQVKIFINI